MFAWIIEGRLGKAAVNDVSSNSVPSPCSIIIVAAEYQHADVPLKDDSSPGNVVSMVEAVILVLQRLAMTRVSAEGGDPLPVVVVCQQGLSRSVTVACLAAALWQGRGFWPVADELKKLDPDVLPHDNLLPVAQTAFPYQFLTEVK